MKKNILDYIEDSKNLALVTAQGKVPKELWEEVKSILRKNDKNWNEFMTACFKKFIDENRSDL